MTPGTDHEEMELLDDEVEDALRRQDEAMQLLERLRSEEPILGAHGAGVDSAGRRDFRRWPAPDGVTLEFHDGTRFHRADVDDIGTGGARLHALPAWIKGPVPARLKTPGMTVAALVLADIMWRDGADGGAGIRFEFYDNEDRENWAGGLIDALLARFAVG